jgi:dolichol-phosphate mannosyltransferase
MKLSIVIPALNEKENIAATIDEVIANCNKIPTVTEYEIIVVDDHSGDGTLETVQRIKNPRVGCIRLSKQSGSHTAIRAGFSRATGDAVLCLSADGQDDPSCIGEMLDQWKKGASVVWALRKHRDNEGLVYRIMAQSFYIMLKLLTDEKSTNIDLANADFFLLDRLAVDALNSCGERNTSLFSLITWLGFDQDFVQYDRRLRRAGISKWNMNKRIQLAKDWIIAFSGLPLRLIKVIGMMIACTGFFYALFIIYNAMYKNNIITGWSSLMVVVLVLGGVQMIMLGVIGEYLWRNFDESKRRPLFFIEKKINIR